MRIQTEADAAKAAAERYAAEVLRLRALVKRVEMQGVGDACPWCRGATWDPKGQHVDCPAFTPEGVVK